MNGESLFLLVAIPLLTILLTIIILQRNARRRARLEHELEILALAEKHKIDGENFDAYVEQKFASFSINQECSFLTHTLFLVQIVFGILILAGFGWWTLVLVKAGMMPWALLTGVFALLGLILPFLVWLTINYRSKAWQRLKEGTENYSQLAAPEPVMRKPAPAIQEKAVVAEEIPEAAAVQKVQPPVVEAVSITRKTAIPEDSMLRRHFLARLRAEIEAKYCSRPTDSMLRRHFDAMIDAALEERLSTMNG